MADRLDASAAEISNAVCWAAVMLRDLANGVEVDREAAAQAALSLSCAFRGKVTDNSLVLSAALHSARVFRETWGADRFDTAIKRVVEILAKGGAADV